MKIVKKNQTKVFKNSESCTAIEYPIGDKDINGTVIELKGRYPDSGWVVNAECKEIVYVISGSGKLVDEGEEVVLELGDVAFIEPGEKYYFEGEMTMFMPCSPAWYSEQHRQVN